MPTGYTAELIERNLDTATWFKEKLSRAFGLTIMFREDGELTEEELKEKLKEYATTENYHTKGLEQAKEDLKKYLKSTDNELQEEIDEKNAETMEYNKQSKEKTDNIKSIHDRAKNDLQKILDDKQSDEVTKNIAKFGIEQINLCKSEEEPYHHELISDIKQYRQEQIANAKRDIEYHTKELKEENQRQKERYECYLTIVADANRILEV